MPGNEKGCFRDENNLSELTVAGYFQIDFNPEMLILLMANFPVVLTARLLKSSVGK